MGLYRITCGNVRHIFVGAKKNANEWARGIYGNDYKIELIPMDVYDNGGKSFDRYTFVYLDTGIRTQHGIQYDCVGTCMTGSGFFMHGICYRGRHLGRKVGFLDLHPDLLARIKNLFL